jgi:hypothetical protein
MGDLGEYTPNLVTLMGPLHKEISADRAKL